MASLGLNELSHWPMGDVEVILTVEFLKSLYRIVTWAIQWALAVKLLSGACHKTTLMRSQHWLFRWLSNGLLPSHYVSSCWCRFMLPYGITRPWVKKDSSCLFQITRVVQSLYWLLIGSFFFINPLSPESDINIKLIQAVEILPCGKQGLFYILLMTWWCTEPGYQQPCYWPSFCSRIFWSRQQKG